ncbi:DUF5667 domain-containing protein [Paraliobacillus sediminis]|uniref:DUF5667 domain-containing protein n=1 Tax=Paraliobacillus sediminis TaxID=1885916 RepID=UPI000E3DA360|nr:DUF5667 domain-containing protein [Paraliobacillus sediminis]
MKIKQLCITSFFVAGVLFTTNSVYAEVDTSQLNEIEDLNNEDAVQNAGLTPDNFFYFLDQAVENLQLLLTTNSEKESELLLQIVAERLSESEQMVDEEQKEHMNELIEEYLVALEKAQEEVAEVVSDEQAADDVKETLASELEDATTVTEEVTESVEEEKLVEFEEKQQEAYLVANVVKDLDSEKVAELRAQDLGFGQIVKVVTLAEESDKTEEEIIALIQDGKGFGEIAKELNIHPSQIMRKVMAKKEKEMELLLEEANASGDEEAITQLSTSLANLDIKKLDFNVSEAELVLENEPVEDEIIETEVVSDETTQDEANDTIVESVEETENELIEATTEKTEETIEAAVEKEEIEEETNEVSKVATEVAKEEKQAAKEEKARLKELEKEAKEQAKEEAKKEKERLKVLEKEAAEQAREEAKEAREKLKEEKKEQASKAKEAAKGKQNKEE